MAIKPQKLTEAQEASIDEYLKSIGLDAIKNEDEAAGSGDRIISGEAVEYKTISGIQNPNSDTLSAAISNRAMNARSQASNVVIDTRGQAGMNEAIALRGAIRAFGADAQISYDSGGTPKLLTIRVIFLEGSGHATDILIPRHD